MPSHVTIRNIVQQLSNKVFITILAALRDIPDSIKTCDILDEKKMMLELANLVCKNDLC